jgi:hypothetical protein
MRLFVYYLTSQHVPNRWVTRCTNKLSIWLCTVNDSHDNWVTVPNNLINNMGERGSLIFWRNNISIFGKLRVRQNVFSAKSPFVKIPLCKMSVRRNVRRQNVRSAKYLSAKCTSFGKMSGYLCYNQNIWVQGNKLEARTKIYPSSMDIVRPIPKIFHRRGFEKVFPFLICAILSRICPT